MTEITRETLRAYLDGMTFKRDKQTPKGHITNDVLWDRVVARKIARESGAQTEAFVRFAERLS